MCISTINGLQQYLIKNSGFSGKVINDVIVALGYNPLNGTKKDFKELSGLFVDCVNKGAKSGFSGFNYTTETIQFFQKHRTAISIHLELTAAEMGIDLISMVQEFGVFRNKEKPTPTEVGKALWDKSKTYPKLTGLYNVFAWYVLEEVANTWYRYLEDNPGYRAELAA